MENTEKDDAILIWETLSKIDCKDHIEKKNGLNYLSWSWAWAITKQQFPTSEYCVRRFNDKPYLVDELLGIMVETSVTIKGLTHSMFLPVMDGANKAQKLQKYEYEVDEWRDKKKTGNKIKKSVESATMFDVNTALMRCLVKNLAMFGLGIYIYAGEDLPMNLEGDKPQEPTEYLIPGSTTDVISKVLYEEIIKIDHQNIPLANEVLKKISNESKAVKGWFNVYCNSKAMRFDVATKQFKPIEIAA